MRKSVAQQLFAAYVRAFESGRHADPAHYVRRAPSQERAQLAEMIDAYLAVAPRREVAATELERLAGSSLVDAILAALEDPSR